MGGTGSCVKAIGKGLIFVGKAVATVATKVVTTVNPYVIVGAAAAYGTYKLYKYCT